MFKKIFGHTTTLVIALVIFLAWIAFQVWNYAKLQCPDNAICTVSMWFGTVPKSLVESYLASSLDSFIFFLFIGAIALVISLKSPEEEDLLKKITYIFPETTNDSELLSYIKGKIAAVACIVTESRRYIDLQDVSDCGNYVRTSIKSESHLLNIYHNHDYINNEMTFSLKSDAIEGQSLWGEVTEVSLTSTTQKLPENHNNLRGNKKLNKDFPEYSKDLSIKLKPAQGAIYKTSCWCWQSIFDEFSFKVNRYTKTQIYNIRNTSDRQFKIEICSEKLKINIGDAIINKISQYLDRKSVSSVNIEKELSDSVNSALAESAVKEKKKEFTLNPKDEFQVHLHSVTPEDKVEVRISVI